MSIVSKRVDSFHASLSNQLTELTQIEHAVDHMNNCSVTIRTKTGGSFNDQLVVGPTNVQVLTSLKAQDYRSSDGTQGISATLRLLDMDGATGHELIFKNGLLVEVNTV